MRCFQECYIHCIKMPPSVPCLISESSPLQLQDNGRGQAAAHQPDLRPGAPPRAAPKPSHSILETPTGSMSYHYPCSIAGDTGQVPWPKSQTSQWWKYNVNPGVTIHSPQLDHSEIHGIETAAPCL